MEVTDGELDKVEVTEQEVKDVDQVEVTEVVDKVVRGV